MENTEFNKEQWKQQKAENKKQTYEMLDEATAAITEDPNKFLSYLDVQSRFGNISVSNALLISHQKPDAKRLGDSAYWLSHGAVIKKGEKAINYLQANESLTPDGEKSRSYTIKKVFDISQTSAKDKDFARHIRDIQLVLALYSTTDLEVQATEILPDGENGVLDENEGSIYIRTGISSDDAFRAASLAIMEHEFSSLDLSEKKKDFISKCGAYMICIRNKIEPPELTFDTGILSSLNNKEVRNLLSIPKKEAARINNEIKDALKDRSIERE